MIQSTMKESVELPALYSVRLNQRKTRKLNPCCDNICFYPKLPTRFRALAKAFSYYS